MQLQEIEDEDHNTGVETKGIMCYIWLSKDKMHLK